MKRFWKYVTGIVPAYGLFPLFFHLYLTVLYIPVQGRSQAVGIITI